MTVTDGGKSEWSFWTATTSGNSSIILPYQQRYFFRQARSG